MSVVVKLTQFFEKKQAESEFAPSMGISEAPDTPLGARAAQDSVQGRGSLQGPLSLSAEPGGKGQDFAESRFVDAAGLDHVDEPVTLPVLGRRAPGQHQRILGALLALALLALIGLTVFALNQADKTAQQLAATGQALMQSQRLAKSVSQALVGTPAAFPDVADSVGVLNQAVDGLANGDDKLSALKGNARTELEAIQPLTARAGKNAATVMAQQKILTQVGTSLQGINRQSLEMLDLAESVSATKLQQNAPAIEISAAGQLVMLTQRIAKSANEFQTLDGGSPEAVFLLGKDLSAFREITRGLLDGSADLRLGSAKDAGMREQLNALLKAYEQMRTDAGAILGNLQGLVAAREAQSSIIAESEPLRRQLEVLQGLLSSQSGISVWLILGMVASALLVLASGAGLALVQLRSSQQRQSVAEGQRQQAESAQLEAKRVNDANQAAILRLMNELQQVAEGDLTQEATVTEDITGAIADSVNYTVEELRALVGSVQNTASRVAQTTAQVDNTSTELLAASTEQLREIRETGRSVLDMASRINEVSTQAQESAAVARQSLQAADSGLQAVQNAIGGMNAIRDQIQDTSKRIKRLGESSQEIGEITELISDITEQTNVLALNAAIQAASAGEAGRGFSVVAEEVQRLAERSADATRQIAALVKGIQTDTQDAVAAMDRSTQGVVAGAQLSDTAGTALTEIDHVSRRLAELIEQISSITSREAEKANIVANNIQHIFAVTEQTGEGTRSTAQQVRELSHMAEELRQSVARFKIS